jgi:hypothetical protein
MADRSGGQSASPLGRIGFRSAALHIASWYVGLTEVGADNRGPMVETALKLAGLGPGHPWCMAFVGMVYEWAATLINRVSPLEVIKQQALVQATVDWAKANGHIVTFDELQPGDLFALWFQHLGRYGHIGFVNTIDRDTSRYTTIEGNSNDEGSREGYAVIGKPRDHGARNVYIRVPD